MKYDKKAVFDEVISRLTRKSGELERITEGEKKHALSQDGAMKSRYDTMRIEGSWLADGLNTRTTEAELEVTHAKSFVLPKDNQKVNVGSLIEVVSDKKVEYYFILPFAGGETVEVSGVEITVITPQSPLALEFIDKPNFYSFRFRGVDYTIINVQ